MKKKDVLITKVSDDIAKVTFQTAKAKKLIGSQAPGYETGMSIVTGDVHKMVTLAISHDLTVDSQVPIIIPEKPKLTREELAKVFPAVPASFLPRTLFAIGTAKFKGDVFDKSEATKKWSVNEQFEKGKEYPVYDYEGIFVVGKDGKGYKMTPKAWTKVKPS